jgi:extracellular factor (EF) 3-hydroxypalmitic acid methyl ester biosynthesis protein
VNRNALPRRLTADVEEFKSRMRSLDRDLARNAEGAGPARKLVSSSCTLVTESFRRHLDEYAEHEHAIAHYMFGETFPYFTLSRLIDRSYVKPHGYAGDYLTIEMVYRNRAMGQRRLGPLIDRWFLDIPASRAVKNRRGLLAGIIRGQVAETSDLRVTSIASGPARELFDVFDVGAVREAGEAPDMHATCIDIDAGALAYTRGTADRAGVSDRLRLVQANAVKLALGRESIELADQDLIYSVGLVDYLRDDLVVALLDWIHSRLRPGGTVIVGNFDIANPDRPFMDHLLDWRLIHRSADDLLALFARSRFSGVPVKIRTESTGINLFGLAVRE